MGSLSARTTPDTLRDRKMSDTCFLPSRALNSRGRLSGDVCLTLQGIKGSIESLGIQDLNR